MKKNLLTIVFASTCLVSFAQITSGVADNEASYQMVNNADLNVIRIVKNNNNKVLGSYYLNEDFQSSTIIYHTSKQRILIPARYNAHSKEIEVKRKNDIVAITPVNGMEVMLGGKSFVPVTNPSNRKTVFAENLYSGTYNLYNLYEIKVNKAPNDATLLNIENKDEIKIRDSYWYNKEQSALKPFPSKKKEISKVFGAEDMAYIKQAKLNLKRSDDLIKFFQYLNQ